MNDAGGGPESIIEFDMDSASVRVLGSLIEKELTTPEYYPLTLNALTAACNQKSNRNPVVSLNEKTVVRSLDELRERKLVRTVSGAEMRVPKYYQRFTEVLELTPNQVAVICVLMLRGPQTLGEIRGRSARLYEFVDLTEVSTVLSELHHRPITALVTELPRQPGLKENRYAHLLSGTVEIAEEEKESRVEAAVLEVRAENERLLYLEETVADLRDEMDKLCRSFAEFKRQFE